MSARIQQKAAIFSGVAFIIAALLHIPDNVFPHGFDKNAPVQLLSLLLISTVYLIYIAIKSEKFRFTRLATYGALALVISQFASLMASGNLIGSLIGDAGRFVGVASVLALLTVAIFHSQFTFSPFVFLLRFYIVAIEGVALAGIAQHFDLIEFPGAHGVSATLGNTDFFAAMLGTTFPLIFFVVLNSTMRARIFLGFAAATNIFALYLAGPLQGYLDLAFVVVGISLYLLRKYIPRRQWTLNARTFLGTFAVIIWAEFIFLMPFLGDFVPVLGNDVQVKIRSNFWLAGMRQFFDHMLFGVGPDQYGNNYEQYRTLEDIIKYTNILSNDAHSASVQTLATLGIVGTAVFIFLIALVIRAFLIIWDNKKIDRGSLFALGLFIFVYLTNSFISPITLIHKFIFWAICGFIAGQVYRLPSRKSEAKLSHKVLPVISAATLFAIAAFFTQGQLNYLTHIERYAKDNAIVQDYTPSAALPCFMYFDAELLMAQNHGPADAKKLAEDELAANPRCVAAAAYLARVAADSGEIEGLGELVNRLIEIAPARNITFTVGMYYANRVGDVKLRQALEVRMKALGLVYIPGKLG